MGAKPENKYRGGIKIDYSRCKGCGTCYEVCPSDVFGFNAETRLLTADYPEDCFFCGACTGCDRCYLFCPEVSIVPPGEGHPGYQADTDYCKGCAVCAAVCPRGVMTMGEKR